MLTVYGIKNCDTCRKALSWLQTEGIAHTFTDLRTDGISDSLLSSWFATPDWQALINRRSTTWRALPASQTQDLTPTTALALARQHPTLLKRPLFAKGKTLLCIGFTPQSKSQVC